MKSSVNRSVVHPAVRAACAPGGAGRLPRTLSALATVSAALALSAPVKAQDAPQRAALEEIVVTAQFREERLQDAPIAITALSGIDIEQRGFTSSADIGYTVPNASFRQAQAAFGNTMTAFIRGIGQNDFNFAFEPGVGMYFDDVYHPTTMGSMIDLMDLDRVEVLRGPQGTLFGRGSIGGAVRFVSRQPQGDDTGSISLTYGQFDRVEVRGSYDFGITDNVYARITGVSKQRDGYQKLVDFTCANPGQAGGLPAQTRNRGNDCVVGTLGDDDVSGARGALRWLASDVVEVNFTVDYMKDRGNTANALIGVAPPSSAPYVAWNDLINNTFGSGANPDWPEVRFDQRFVPDSPFISYASFSDPILGYNLTPRTGLEQWGVSGKVDWDLNDTMTLTTILSYREFESVFSHSHGADPLGVQLVDGIQEFESFTGEIRLSGRWNDRLDYTVGYFRYDGKASNAQMVSLPALHAPGANFLVNGLILGDFENNSVFSHLIFDVNDSLALTAGLRWSEDRKIADFDNTVFQAFVDSKDDSFDYRFGLDYRFTDDVMAYASVASGYRPQAFNPRPFQPTQFVQVANEDAVSYEIGTKTDLFDRSLRLNAAVFFIDYKGRIVAQGGAEPQLDGAGNPVLDGDGNPVMIPRTAYVNVPGESYGFELEATWRPIEGLSIGGVYGHTTWSSDDLADTVIDRPPFVPKRNWAANVAYEFFFADGATVTPRLDVYGQSEICTNTTTLTSCSPGYEILNGRLEYASPGRDWTAAFGVTNLTNKDYFLNKFDLSAFGQQTIEGQPGRPREWYVSFTRSF